ncbi:hypothetical protein [Paraburkholderia unamae]|uniref:Uncharacterized protein n=1 Tax=Paraburkholderia unamae TaxID=219649 RepID=A0ACC6RPW6_9BURK
MKPQAEQKQQKKRKGKRRDPQPVTRHDAKPAKGRYARRDMRALDDDGA